MATITIPIMNTIRSLYLLLVMTTLFNSHRLSAEVQFNVIFEPGSKWYTQTYSDDARAAMESYFVDLGKLFTSTATVKVTVTDNETSAYASTDSSWYDYVTLDGLVGEYYAPAAWIIINRGVDNNGSASDVTVNWNMDVDALYDGDPNWMIGNFRGLGRHEMHHAFGEISFFSHNESSDPRGGERTATVASTMIFDKNNHSILDTYNSVTKRFRISDYVLNAEWSGSNSGLYFAGLDASGDRVPMPLKSYSTSIDYSHYNGIAYVNDHPTWSTYEEPDYNFLRAMGYSLTIDRTEYIPITSIEVTPEIVTLRFDSLVGAIYSMETSMDLMDWDVSTEEITGTGSKILHEVTRNVPLKPKMFYRIQLINP